MTAFCVEAHDDDKWECTDAPRSDYTPPRRVRDAMRALRLELGSRVCGDMSKENQRNTSRLVAVLRRRVSGYGNKEAS